MGILWDDMAARDRLRVSVDLPDGLLEELDEQVEDDLWLNRSEAIRYGIRKALSERHDERRPGVSIHEYER